MASFRNQVVALAGTITSGTELNDQMSDGIRDTITRVGLTRPDLLYQFAQTATVGTSGLSMNGYLGKPLDVYRGTYESREIPPALRFRADDSESLHRASTRHPVHYFLNDTVIVLPQPSANQAFASVIAPADADCTTATIDNFPEAMYRLPVLYGAAEQVKSLMSDTIQDIPADITLPTAATIDFTNAKTLTAAVEVATESLPTLSWPATPTIADLDMSGITLPTAPATPSYTAISISLATAPDYTKPSPTFTATPTISDLTVSATVPAVLTAPSFTTPSITLATAPTYTKPSPPLAFSGEMTHLDTYIDTDEDLEQAMAKVQQLQADIQAYISDIQNELNEFNKEVEIYQRTLEKDIAETRTILEEEVGEYGAKIQRYQAELQQYANRVSEQVQQFNANVAKDIGLWSPQLQTQMAQYQADISNELNEFQKAVEIYRTTLQKDTAESSTKLQKENTEYLAKLEKYSRELAAYTAEVNLEVQEYTINELQKELAIWVQECGNALNEYQAEAAAIINKYSAEVASKLNLTQAEVSIFSAETQRLAELNRSNIADYTARANALITDFQARIAKRQAKYVMYQELYNRLREEYDRGFIPFTQEAQQ